MQTESNIGEKNVRKFTRKAKDPKYKEKCERSIGSALKKTGKIRNALENNRTS